MNASREDRELRAYVAAYTDETRALRPDAIARRQPPPYAALSHGAGGIAYMYGHLDDHRRAREWLDALLADRRRDAYALEGHPQAPSALLYGRAGLHWLSAWLGGPRRERSIATFVQLARRCTDTLDFVAGAPGLLAGARSLLAREPHPRLHELAHELASRIVARVRRRRAWKSVDAFGFAHGWPGALYSLLAWIEHTREQPPRWLIASLDRLRRAWSPNDVPDPDFAASWCNGAAGTVLLWTRAFVVCRDEAFLIAARAAARVAIAVDEQRNYVCCGRAGIAHALRTLAQYDRRESWIVAARRLVLAAVRPQPMAWPNGLLLGHPGIVCLASALARDQLPTLPIA